MSAETLKRVGSAILLVPAFVWLVESGPSWLFAALVVASAAAASWELGRMFEHAGRPAALWLNLVTTVAVTASFLQPRWSAPALTVAVLVILSSPLWRDGPLTLEPVGIALFATVYIAWLLGHALLLYRLAAGPSLILLLVGVTWAGETSAWAVGSAFGRHPLAPVISPRKTIEGAVAQSLGSILAALVLAAWLLPDWSTSMAAAAGALLGVMGQIGDLAESVIKRTLGAKDTGGLIPGHGGILDRLDSLLFNVPALFYLVTRLGEGR